MDVTLAIDAMGGDHGADGHCSCRSRVSEAVPERYHHSGGYPDAIDTELRALSVRNPGCVCAYIRPAKWWAWTNCRNPHLRGKKDSSMRVGINLVKSGEALACVSAGNTGALMATARYVLKTIRASTGPR